MERRRAHRSFLWHACEACRAFQRSIAASSTPGRAFHPGRCRPRVSAKLLAGGLTSRIEMRAAHHALPPGGAPELPVSCLRGTTAGADPDPHHGRTGSAPRVDRDEGNLGLARNVDINKFLALESLGKCSWAGNKFKAVGWQRREQHTSIAERISAFAHPTRSITKRNSATHA